MKVKKLFISLISICIAFLCVFTGCSSSPSWVRNTIRMYYYRFDGDYSDFEDMSGLSIGEMVAKLDIYSGYYTREEYARVIADNEGNKSGVGVSYTFEEGAGVVFRSVIGNSPAKKEGLKAGDVAVSALTYNGESVEFKKSADFSGFITARGDGENFTLNLSDGRSVTLAKADYTASYVSMYTSDITYDIEYENGVRKIVESEGGIEQLPEGTAYMYMSQFFGKADEEMAALIEKFNAKGCTSLILDLRDNGGGYVDLMAKIGGLFTASINDEQHVAMIARFKDGSEAVTNCEEFSRDSDKFNTCVVPKGTDVYVMANGNTASASEALIGVLVSYDILKYENIFLSKYGDSPVKSYGKGIMQSVFENYITGEALKLTVAGIYWPKNDKTIHGVGLTEADGCTAAPAPDSIVNVGYDYELEPVIAKIKAVRAGQNA